MAEKKINNIRVINKHDIEANWIKATGFIPKQGELIVYDIDDNYSYERIKIGDGVHNVNDLPFYAGSWEDLSDRPFGVETVLNRTTVHETTINNTNSAVNSRYIGYDISDLEDKNVIVTVNGVEYESVCKWDSTTGGCRITLGNDVYEIYQSATEFNATIDNLEAITYEVKIETVETTENIVVIDEQFIPDTIARVSDVDEVKGLVGDTSVSEQINTAAINNQSDWSVNDETNPAYVKNRTHWVEVVPTTFLDNETLSFTHYTDNMYMCNFENSNGFVVGDTYNVTWNGVEYTCIAFNYSIYTAIGNINIVSESDENTTEPFFAYSYDGQMVFITNSTEVNNTVSLFGDVTTYYTIDKKYLPRLIGQEGVGAGAEIFNEYTGINTASGDYSHAEGYSTDASGMRSHAEGWATTASGHNSHSEGFGTESSGAASHAEGSSTEATGRQSHAEGDRTVASGWASHAEGIRTTAASDYQHVQGMLNIVDSDKKYLHIVGNGNFDAITSNPSNAHTLDWSGNAWFQGTVKIGGTGQDDEAAKELATQEYVKSFLPKITTITLPAANWTGDTNPWSQVVTVNGVTENSKVDLQPTAVQIVELQNNEITLMLQNDNGVVTALAIGNKPAQDYTMQVLITEVVRV